MLETPIQIRFNDIDLQGHMYNGQYMHLFDLGKNEFFDHVIGVGDMNGDRAVITARTTTNFYTPVGLRDQLVIRTGLKKIGTKSFAMFQQMVNRKTEEVVADCETVMVGYDVKRRESFEIPADWREKMEKNLIPED